MKRFMNKAVLTSAVYVVILSLVTMTCSQFDLDNPVDRDGGAYQCDDYFRGGCNTTPPPTLHAIMFDANGGSGNQPTIPPAENGAEIILPNQGGLSRDGHIFGGWNTNADGSGTSFSAGASYIVTSAAILYAVWIAADAPTHTIMFDANGGSGAPPAAQTASVGSSITLPQQGDMSHDGYNFGGWNTNADGSGTTFGGGTSYSVTGDAAMYAVWIAADAQSFTVTVSGGTGGGSFQAGRQVTITATPPVGQTFVNWTTASGVTFANANSATTTFTMPSNDVTVTANFATAQTFTLTTNVAPSGGGSVSRNPNATSYAQDATVTVTANPASGFRFVNWSGTDAPSPANANPAVIVMSADRTIMANFEQIQAPPQGDTIKVEAESMRENLFPCPGDGSVRPPFVSNPLESHPCINNGIMAWIVEDAVVSYDVNVAQAGSYSMIFRIASGVATPPRRFNVSVNGVNVGQVSYTGTAGDWGTFADVLLGVNVNLNAGSNRIVITFLTDSVNFDYFLLVRDGGVTPPPFVWDGYLTRFESGARNNLENSHSVIWAGNVGDTSRFSNWLSMPIDIGDGPAEPGSRFLAPFANVGRSGAAGGIVLSSIPSNTSTYHPVWGLSVGWGTAETSAFNELYAGAGARFEDIDSIVFWARAEGGVRTFIFEIETVESRTIGGHNAYSVFIGPKGTSVNHYHPTAPNVSTEWQRYSIALQPVVAASSEGVEITGTLPSNETGRAGVLRQRHYFGSIYTFVPGNAAGLAFQIRGEENASTSGGALYIDDIQFIGPNFRYNP